MCMLPWISMETTPLGNARPCCLAKDFVTDENGAPYDLNTHTMKEIYDSKYMQDLRQEFRDGKRPATCQRCWDEEAAGRHSKRMMTQIRLGDYESTVDYDTNTPNQLWFLDLKLGNICNLKCRICGSWSSSKWAGEEMDYVSEYMDPKEHMAYKWLQQGQWPRKSTVFWEDMEELLPNVRYIEFTGGEPFLIPEHFRMLQYAVDHNLAKGIELHYNTNGTVYPAEYVHLWKEFKAVEIAFSIDNVGSRYDYERYLAKWDSVVSNIVKFHTLRAEASNITTQVCMTVNVQNVYYLEELCAWVDTQGFDYQHFNMLHDPSHMNIGSMPKEAKDLVIDKLWSGNFSHDHRLEINKIIKFIENGKCGSGEKFHHEMMRTDEYRQQKFSTTHPEIAKVMRLL